MKSINVIRKKKGRRGRPATGQDPVTAVRLPDELRAAIDRWAANNRTTRSKAIRLLIERGLSN